KSTCLTEEDLKAAASSPNVKKLLEIAQAVSTGNVKVRFDDLPRQSKTSGQAATANAAATNLEEAGEALSQISRRLKQQESRQHKKKARDKAARQALSEDDLRLGADALAKF